MKNKKGIILFSSIACLTIIGISANSLLSNNSKTIASNDNNLDIAKVVNNVNVDNDKTFHIRSEFSFEYEPTIENLYKNADIVIIGTFDSDLKTYANGVNIHTQTKFNTSKVLKNETKLDVKENVTFDRIGGTMALSDYMKNNNTIREDEFTDISEQERSSYSVIQEFAPNDKLNFTSSKSTTATTSVTSGDKEYVLFLNYSEDKLMLNSTYYGMRELNNNKIFDYDTNQYIDSSLVKK